MPTLRLGATVNLWSTELVSGLTAGDHSAEAEFLPGQARGFAAIELSFSASPTAFDIDIEFSEAGEIWRRLVNFANALPESFSCAATPGHYRAKVNSLTAAGAETVTLTIAAGTEAPQAFDNIEIDEASGDTAGAVLRMGTSSFPLVKDTAATAFIYGNFTSAATSGWTLKGMDIKLATTGAHTGNANALAVTLAPAAYLKNNAAISCDVIYGALGYATGRSSGLSVYYSFPARIMPNGGNYIGINIEFACPATFDRGTPGSAAPVRTAMLGFSMAGDTTAKATFESDGTIMSFVGFTAGQYAVVSNQRLAELPAGSIGLRIGVGPGGTGDAFYFIPAVPLAEWN